MSSDTKGFRSKYLVDEVEKHLGEKGISTLKFVYKGSLDFQASTIYSEEENVKLTRAVANTLFDKDDAHGFIEVGRIIARRDYQGIIGRTITKLLSTGLFKGIFFSSGFLKMMEMETAPFTLI